MKSGVPLEEYLARQSTDCAFAADVTSAIVKLAGAASEIGQLIAQGGLTAGLGDSLGRSGGGDLQKGLDLKAHTLVRVALRGTAVAAFASEEAEGVELLNPAGTLCVAVDPVDGSGNLDVNMPLGMIFSVLAMPEPKGASSETFQWPIGTSQLAAGFVVYGPQTALILTTGGTVDMFTLGGDGQTFRLAQENLRMPAAAPNEYAINGSNYRYWEEPVRAYVDDCLAGASGPHGRDFNMRWHGALVAEAFRILLRGGIYLYPGDAREGHRDGRLRLIYEAYPMALLVERAGGAASTGRRRILDIEATSPHQRVPLIFGSSEMVQRVEGLHHRPGLWPPTAAPLFASRSLFRS